MSPAAPSFMLPLHSCWPTDWLAADFPTARMLTIEYPAPFTNTEVRAAAPGCGRGVPGGRPGLGVPGGRRGLGVCGAESC
eukprot:160132-Chlamydomonas_euryale.AAC.1